MFPKEFQSLITRASSIEIIADNAHTQAQSETKAALQSGQCEVVRRPTKTRPSRTRRCRRVRRRITPPACRWKSSPSKFDESPKYRRAVVRSDSAPKMTPRRGSMEAIADVSLKYKEAQLHSTCIQMPARKASIDISSLDILLPIDVSCTNSDTSTQSTSRCYKHMDTAALLDQVLDDLQIYDEDEDYTTANTNAALCA